MSEQNNDVKVCQLDFFLFQHFNKQVLQQCIFVKSHFFNAEIVQTVEHKILYLLSEQFCVTDKKADHFSIKNAVS